MTGTLPGESVTGTSEALLLLLWPVARRLSGSVVRPCAAYVLGRAITPRSCWAGVEPRRRGCGRNPKWRPHRLLPRKQDQSRNCRTNREYQQHVPGQQGQYQRECQNQAADKL